MDRQNAKGGCDQPPSVSNGPRADAPDPELCKRRAALFSVYYHTHERGGFARFLLPEQLRPMRLERAVSAVHSADQRLALARLIGAGGLEKRHGLYESTKKLFASVEDLDIDRFMGRFLRSLGELIRSDIIEVDGEYIFDHKKVALLLDSQGYGAVAYNEVLGTAFEPSENPGCIQSATQTDVDFDISTLVSTATVVIDVKRNPGKLAAVLDPVSWQTLGPDYFEFSYKVKQDGNGQVVWTDGLPDQDDHEPGDSWNGLLYEVFHWNWNENTLCTFRNLLNIDFQATQTSITMKYSLSRSIDSVVGFDFQEGGIDVDSGEVSAVYSPTTQQFSLTATKNVRFTSRMPGSVAQGMPFDLGMGLNYMAPALVGIFLDKAVSLGVCATLPP
jgi:hypothetical protein